jgi:hypothetical protein
MQDGGMGNAGSTRHILKPQACRTFGRHAGFGSIQDQDACLFRLTANTFLFLYQVVTSLLTIL